MLKIHCNRCSHAVSLGNSPDVVGCGNGTSNRGLLLIIREAFACKIGTSSLRNLKDDR